MAIIASYINLITLVLDKEVSSQIEMALKHPRNMKLFKFLGRFIIL